MPIYEYQCQSCGLKIEVMQRMSEPPLTLCEQCGGDLKKLISAPAFQFKGDGWYVTDYAKKDGGKGKDSSSSKGDDSGDSKGGDSKGGSDSGGSDSGGSSDGGGSGSTQSSDSGSRSKTSKSGGSESAS